MFVCRMDMINKCDLMRGAKQNEDQMQIERLRNDEAFDRNVKYNKSKESE